MRTRRPLQTWRGIVAGTVLWPLLMAAYLLCSGNADYLYRHRLYVLPAHTLEGAILGVLVSLSAVWFNKNTAFTACRIWLFAGLLAVTGAVLGLASVVILSLCVDKPSLVEYLTGFALRTLTGAICGFSIACVMAAGHSE
jgi:predicted membrane protein